MITIDYERGRFVRLRFITFGLRRKYAPAAIPMSEGQVRAYIRNGTARDYQLTDAARAEIERRDR